MNELKNAPISTTKRIKQEFNLINEEDKAKFASFESFVAGVCKTAIRTCYGQFVVLTAPLLSQVQLAGMASKLKKEFPSVYTTISSLLN
jgi:hypothetical protein